MFDCFCDDEYQPKPPTFLQKLKYKVWDRPKFLLRWSRFGVALANFYYRIFPPKLYFPVVRAKVPTLNLAELVSVQPMQEPSGLKFYLRNKYSK